MGIARSGARMKQIGSEPAAEDAAGIAEIQDAIGSLSPGDAVRLERFARNRVARVGWAAQQRTYEDLFHDAIVAALSGTRRWNPSKATLVQCLMGAMKSISSHWAEHQRTEPERTGLDSGEGMNVPVHDPDSLAARETLSRLETIFSDDEDAFLVIEGWRNGMKGPEIRTSLGFSETKYETVVRRIRRKADPLRPKSVSAIAKKLGAVDVH